MVTKGHTYLSKSSLKVAGLFKYVRDLLLPPGIKGLKYLFGTTFSVTIYAKFS